MNHIKRAGADSHSYFEHSVRVTEFNFPDDSFINDAEITVLGRYPLAGYAVNDISVALVSIESGTGYVTIKGSNPQKLATGDRLLIKTGEPYAFTASRELNIRYIAVPAWHPSQSRIIDD